jgi:hypothetical protein
MISVFSKTWFSSKTSTYGDACSGKKITILDNSGKVVTKNAYPEINEMYCDNEAKAVLSADSSTLGSGYCIPETIKVPISDTKNKSVASAKWVNIESVCTDDSLTVKDQFNNKYKDYCSENNFINYSCGENNQVITQNVSCYGKCSASTGCTSYCDNSSINLDPSIKGSISYDGVKYSDSCKETGSTVTIKQAECLSTTARKESTLNFKDSCNGSVYVDYSCDGDVLKKVETSCPGQCSQAKGGCYGFCDASSDTDSSQNPLVGGTLLNSGIYYNDTCGKNEKGVYVKQYSCSDSTTLSNVISYCTSQQECAKDENGYGYCRDKISTTGTVAEIEDRLDELESLVSSLTSQISELSSRIDALQSA